MPTPKEELAKYISATDASTGYLDTMDLFSVARYGAVSGSTVSQGSAINACIDAAVSAGSKVVYFPPGTYWTTGFSSNSTSVAMVGDNASYTTGGSTYDIAQIFAFNSLNSLSPISGNIDIAGGTSNVTVSASSDTGQVSISVADSSSVTALYGALSSDINTSELLIILMA